MKLLSILIMVIILLTGCNNGQNEQINYKTSQSSTPKPQKIYGTFSTKITDKKPERLNNIKVGTEKLNGAIIKAGEEFSLPILIKSDSIQDRYAQKFSCKIIINSDYITYKKRKQYIKIF